MVKLSGSVAADAVKAGRSSYIEVLFCLRLHTVDVIRFNVFERILRFSEIRKPEVHT